MVLAQASTVSSLAGWYVGYAIAVVVVLAVVVVVVAILSSASAISRQARQATQALEAAQRSTRALWDVAQVNHAAGRLLRDARAVRQALGG